MRKVIHLGDMDLQSYKIQAHFIFKGKKYTDDENLDPLIKALLIRQKFMHEENKGLTRQFWLMAVVAIIATLI